MQASVAVDCNTLRSPSGSSNSIQCPNRSDGVAVDAIGFQWHRTAAIFCQNLAALGQPDVVDPGCRVIPDRLGEFRLQIHRVHDPQIGREPGGEALEILLQMPRRWRRAICATQLSFAAASRIPQPSSRVRKRRPRRSAAAPRPPRTAPACPAAAAMAQPVALVEPEDVIKKFPDDCASAPPDHSATTSAAAVAPTFLHRIGAVSICLITNPYHECRRHQQAFSRFPSA